MAGLALLFVIGAGCVMSSNTQPDLPMGWQSTTDKAAGVTFAYPSDMQKTYYNAQDWPPKVQVLDQPYGCLEAGSSDAPPGGVTREYAIKGHTYCVTIESEGAAGNVYTMYAYAFAKDNKTVILTFSIHTVQCMNYDASKQSDCKLEQAALNVDTMADRMAQSVTWVSA